LGYYREATCRCYILNDVIVDSKYTLPVLEVFGYIGSWQN